MKDHSFEKSFKVESLEMTHRDFDLLTRSLV